MKKLIGLLIVFISISAESFSQKKNIIHNPMYSLEMNRLIASSIKSGIKIPDTKYLLAYEQLIKELKEAGLWDKMTMTSFGDGFYYKEYNKTVKMGVRQSVFMPRLNY